MFQIFAMSSLQRTWLELQPGRGKPGLASYDPSRDAVPTKDLAALKREAMEALGTAQRRIA